MSVSPQSHRLSLSASALFDALADRDGTLPAYQKTLSGLQDDLAAILHRDQYDRLIEMLNDRRRRVELRPRMEP